MSYLEMDLTALTAALREGRVSSRELVLDAFLRVKDHDHAPGGANAMLELNPDALALADELDRRRRAGGALGPLHGVPVVLKDNISTRDGMRTSAGSLSLGDNFAVEDAWVVGKLRRAGALLLGKANMTEFANYMTRGMPGGFSSRGGQVLNPYDASANAAGSSTGSAAAVATRLCPVAVGTETSGSIVSPARVQGLVGVKPSLGLVSRSGIIPIAFTLDTAGPLARSVRDAAILLEVLAGPDEGDPITQGGILPQGGYLPALRQDGLDGLRVGVYQPEALQPESPPYATQAFTRLLWESGAVLSQMPALSFSPAEILSPIMTHEIGPGLRRYLATYGRHAKMRTLSDIIAFNMKTPGITLKYGQSLLIEAEDCSGSLCDDAYLSAILLRERAIREVGAWFDTAGVDVVYMPTALPGLPALCGLPSASLPIGLEGGVPVGGFFFARRFQEATLLRALHAAEGMLGLSLHP